VFDLFQNLILYSHHQHEKEDTLLIVIGEKINGTIPSVGEAIAQKNMAFIRDLALKQSEAGAGYIDVCAGVTPDIELETLRSLIETVQNATETPLCIDSSNPKTIKDALGFVKNQGIINSVSLEGEKMEIIFPLIAGTEWSCIALLCDKDGIPRTVEKRLEIARTIIDRAGAAGIAPNRLHIDPLVMALSAEGSSMTMFMKCAAAIKQWEPDIHITSGLSNISYSLPQRKSVNQAFLTLAMGAGMDSAIMDPLNKQMMAAVYATEALLEKDRLCLKYIKAYRKGLIRI
jgi:5-methyltetrahydrofolate--homocysteine methyltransferase